MIPRSKHIAIVVLIVLAALCGLLFARGTTTRLNVGTAAVLDSLTPDATTTEGRVVPADNDEAKRREAARSALLEQLNTH